MINKKLRDDDGASQTEQRTPHQTLMDRIKDHWAKVHGFARLQADLLALPAAGRLSGICESWHCAMWQHGRMGAAKALSVAHRHGWRPDQQQDQRQQALQRGHLDMARSGDEAADLQRTNRSRIGGPSLHQGENIMAHWRRMHPSERDTDATIDHWRDQEAAP